MANDKRVVQRASRQKAEPVILDAGPNGKPDGTPDLFVLPLENPGVVQDQRYKLIWNIANKLDYPFASDLWAASSWQAQFQKGEDAPYGKKTVGQYIHRPKFELFDLKNDPHEAYNLAEKPEFAELLKTYQAKMKSMQKKLDDPWILKWKYE